MKITVKETYRTLEKGWEYNFTDLNTIKSVTIVGENGCGKSSLIHALRGHVNEPNNRSLHKSDYVKLSKNVNIEHDYEKILFFDAIKDNGMDFMNAYDAVGLLESGGHAAQRMSHGQGALMYIHKFMSENEKSFIPNKTLLVFDEIDNGLSLSNLVKFNNFILNLKIKYNCHVLIISHNPFFISQSIIVYDFNKRTFVSSDEYITEVTGFTLTKNNK